MTRKGLINGIIASVIWLLGYLTNNYALLVLGLFLVLLVLCVHLYLFIPRKIEIIDAGVSGEVVAEQIAVLHLRAKSSRLLRWLTINLARNGDSIFRRKISTTENISNLEVNIANVTRGYYDADSVEIRIEDPWGISSRRITTTKVRPYWVYPKPISVKATTLALRKTQTSDGNNSMAGEDVFSTVREYVVGDEIRKIHWKSSARTGKLIVKETVTSSRNEVLLFLDTNLASYPAQPGSGVLFNEEYFEKAVSLTAGLVKQAFNTGTPISIYSQDKGLLQFSSSASITEYMEYLATVKTTRPVAKDEANEFGHHFQSLDLTQAILISYKPSKSELAKVSLESTRIGHFQFLDVTNE